MNDDAAGAVRRTPRPETVDQLAGLIEVGLHPPAAECAHCENARRAADRILDAGWRPPVREEPRADDWCRAEHCPHRNWRSGSVPTHKIGSGCPEPAPAPRGGLRAERDAILPRLAELAEAAGKLRTAEWLRTCATLPMEEWPPAPAYKGPMVPAAERDALQARIDAALAKLDKVREDARELIELREKGAPIDLAPMSAVDDLEKTIRAALQATEESGR